MSASALHQYFKVVTGTSPLQFQKHIRLLEARRLMLSQAVDAAVAAHAVGYESPSQFSRQYRRLFGAPPSRDIAQLRAQWGGEFPDFGQVFAERSTAGAGVGIGVACAMTAEGDGFAADDLSSSFARVELFLQPATNSGRTRISEKIRRSIPFY